jgi:hypothetical protein
LTVQASASWARTPSSVEPLVPAVAAGGDDHLPVGVQVEGLLFVGPVENHSAPSNQTVTSGLTCGLPSRRPVVIHDNSAAGSVLADPLRSSVVTSTGARTPRPANSTALPLGNGPLDPLEPLGDVGYFWRRLAARGALKDGPDVAGVAEMPGSGLPFELIDHVDGQAQRGGCHRLRLDPVARLHLRAGVVDVVVLS